MRATTAIVRLDHEGETAALPATRGDDWLECCLDEGVVLHWQAAPAGGTAPEDDVTWLVPERDGDGYVAVTVARDCDLVDAIALD
jgi:hypothetical protein